MRKRKYRPGIDDPPPAFSKSVIGILGLTAVATFVVTLLTRGGKKSPPPD